MYKMEIEKIEEQAAEAKLDEECLSCGDPDFDEKCPNSRRPCGHHCNHSATHDHCCWCGKEWGEEG